MKFSPKAALTACLLALVSCGGGDLESRSVDTMNDFISTLEGIDDKESAEAAVSDLKEIIAKMNALEEEGEKLPKEEKDALEAKMTKDHAELITKMMGALGNIAKKPEVAAILEPVLEEM